MNRIPYNKLEAPSQYGSGQENDIRTHPQFPYFKAFYENQVKEIRTKMKAPPLNSNLPTAEFIPPPRGSQAPIPVKTNRVTPPRGSQMPNQQMPQMASQMLMSGVPGLGMLQMLKKQNSGGSSNPSQSRLEEIEKRGVVKRNPPLVREDEYLLQQYKHPRIRPDLKLHGMVKEKEFEPRPFRESDIPQLNPYALVTDDGSGFELGKLYAYERKSF